MLLPYVKPQLTSQIIYVLFNNRIVYRTSSKRRNRIQLTQAPFMQRPLYNSCICIKSTTQKHDVEFC